jgi:hypothetical protein
MGIKDGTSLYRYDRLISKGVRAMSCAQRSM